jgi:hypothetical protein
MRKLAARLNPMARPAQHLTLCQLRNPQLVAISQRPQPTRVDRFSRPVNMVNLKLFTRPTRGTATAL